MTVRDLGHPGQVPPLCGPSPHLARAVPGCGPHRCKAVRPGSGGEGSETWGTAEIGGPSVLCNPFAGSWSSCIVASWMRRIGSSQPSTTTLGPGQVCPSSSAPSFPVPAPPPRIPVLTTQVPPAGHNSQTPAGAAAEQQLQPPPGPPQGPDRAPGPLSCSPGELSWMGPAGCPLWDAPRPKTRAIK